MSVELDVPPSKNVLPPTLNDWCCGSQHECKFRAVHWITLPCSLFALCKKCSAGTCSSSAVHAMPTTLDICSCTSSPRLPHNNHDCPRNGSPMAVPMETRSDRLGKPHDPPPGLFDAPTLYLNGPTTDAGHIVSFHPGQSATPRRLDGRCVHCKLALNPSRTRVSPTLKLCQMITNPLRNSSPQEPPHNSLNIYGELILFLVTQRNSKLLTVPTSAHSDQAANTCYTN